MNNLYREVINFLENKLKKNVWSEGQWLNEISPESVNSVN
jgi:hypothetical protein